MGWMIGAGLGFLFGGPLGAIVGGAMQYALGGQGNQESFQQGGRPANSEAQFIAHLVTILTRIAMADGRVTREEVAAIHNFFANELGYGGLELRFIDGLINQTQVVKPDLGEVARHFRDTNTVENTQLLLDLCYRIAASDGKICIQEQRELRFLREALNISEEDHQRIRYKYSGFEGGSSNANEEKVHPPKMGDYGVLGLSHTASNDELKKAYRQMASQYHPDKVSHLGPELVEFANKKFSEINSAYNNIKKSRGL